MGTRGFVGFGVDVLTWLRTAVEDLDTLRRQASELRVVDEATPPTEQDAERLRPFMDTNVGRQSQADWYCLLRGTQGDPAAILRAGAIEDAATFPSDSLYAEYGYLVDLDAQAFEAYIGFQCAKPSAGLVRRP